ncbi:unnamed protein product [Aureobasidium pullulans]|nr:unnamed protein product [Aureobasidium pullulans]
MKYLAAYLLLNLAGNEQPSAEDIKSVLSSVGVDAEGERLDKLISELEGKNIQEVRINPPNRKFSIANALLTPSTADLRGFRQARLRSFRWCWCRRWLCSRCWCRRRGCPPPRRRPRRRRSPTTTWASVSSTKRLATSVEKNRCARVVLFVGAVGRMGKGLYVKAAKGTAIL